MFTAPLPTNCLSTLQKQNAQNKYLLSRREQHFLIWVSSSCHGAYGVNYVETKYRFPQGSLTNWIFCSDTTKLSWGTDASDWDQVSTGISLIFQQQQHDKFCHTYGKHIFVLLNCLNVLIKKPRGGRCISIQSQSSQMLEFIYYFCHDFKN